MTERYLSLTEIARQLGITTASVAQAHLPPADAVIGKTRGWKQETVEQWVKQRPGRGVGGGRPRRTQLTGDPGVPM
jgi:predicted DNA-binding transcriptional regulator AlpA